jgi:rhodanese-related sulfurtransferase
VSERQTVGSLLTGARARIERLEPEAAQAALAAGALLIDTRCAELRLESGVIPGSIHVPLSVLYWRMDPTSGHDDPTLTDSDRQVILVCAHGYSSSLAAATLLDLGIREPPMSSVGSKGGSKPGCRRQVVGQATRRNRMI